MICRVQIHARLLARGVAPSAFWSWAMGGDRLDAVNTDVLDSWIDRFLGGAS